MHEPCRVPARHSAHAFRRLLLSPNSTSQHTCARATHPAQHWPVPHCLVSSPTFDTGQFITGGVRMENNFSPKSGIAWPGWHAKAGQMTDPSTSTTRRPRARKGISPLYSLDLVHATEIPHFSWSSANSVPMGSMQAVFMGHFRPTLGGTP